MNEFQNFLTQELTRLYRKRLNRTLKEHNGIDFSSNDYLSLNSRGTLQRMLNNIIEESTPQAGSTGSRLIRGHYEAFERAEERFAQYTGHEAALLFHSGYAANTGTLDALISPRDIVFVDKLIHASLIDGIRLSGARRYYFAHNDIDDLRNKIKKHSKRLSSVKDESQTPTNIKSDSRMWIVTESIFSMDGDLAELNELVQVAEETGAVMIVDEAHAIGVLGRCGAGLVAGLNLQERVAVTIYPCGKAPGLMGAFVCGSHKLKEYLINKARSFIFTTAQPPLMAMLLDRVICFLQSEEADRLRDDLLERVTYFNKQSSKNGIVDKSSLYYIQPIIVGEEEATLNLERKLAQEGFDVRAIRPPSVPADSSRLRITLHAERSIKDIDALISCIEWTTLFCK